MHLFIDAGFSQNRDSLKTTDVGEKSAFLLHKQPDLRTDEGQKQQEAKDCFL